MRARPLVRAALPTIGRVILIRALWFLGIAGAITLLSSAQ